MLSELNINQIFNKDRNKILDLLNIGKILYKGFQYNNKHTEIYYGSAITESTYTLSNDLLRLTQSSYDMNDLERILGGTYKPPISNKDYLKM